MPYPREIILVLLTASSLFLSVTCSHSVLQPESIKKLQLPKELAGSLEIIAEPDYPGRYYNHSNQVEEGPTFPLLKKRRAFSPSEDVVLKFKLPENVQVERSLTLKVIITLHSMHGTKVQDVGETEVQASPSQLGGQVRWTVPALSEGEYFLAGGFLEPDGNWLMTRSEIIFITPEYLPLHAAAEEAIRAAAWRLGSAGSLLRSTSLPSVEMLLEDAERRWYDFGQAHRDWGFVKNNLEEARWSADQLMAGKDPFAGKTGVFIKAFRSDLDDTLQPYALYVPRSYTPSRLYPLLVSLHGATSNHRINIRRVFGFGNRPGESDYEATRNEVELPQVDFIVASPYGRGETAGYHGISEQDVLRVMADVQKAYSIDPDRVYLTGLSMGGGGTWHIGLRYPDKFAAIVPVCAVGDMDLSFKPGTLPDYGRQLYSVNGPSAIAENASNLMVFIYHGDMDDAVPVGASRRMVEKFKSFGWLDKNVHYFELPGVQHPAWDLSYRDGNIFKILAPIRRNPFPRRVVYSTFSTRFHQAYWLRIDRIDKGLQLARIEGNFNGNVFSIQVDNISAFSILLDPKMVPPGEQIRVEVGGVVVYSGSPSDKILGFSQSSKDSFSQRNWDGDPVGPPDHIEAGFRNRTIVQTGRHIYVYGTGGDAETQSASRSLTEKLADWGPEVKVRWKIVADRDLTPSDLESSNLVLVGNSTINQLVARVKEKLPIEEQAGRLQAGDQSVTGKDTAYRLIYPNPLAPSRYVCILGAGTAAGLQNLARLEQTPKSPHQNADFLLLDEQGRVKAAGLFKDRWKIGE